MPKSAFWGARGEFEVADTMTKERRSEVMSHIKSKNTSIELLVRQELFRRGLRYRVNYKELPGKPDIVFTRKRIAIFIHGCFWHGHECKSRYAHTSQSNTSYWSHKITQTKNRDYNHILELERNGWKVITIWECQIKDSFPVTINNLLEELL